MTPAKAARASLLMLSVALVAAGGTPSRAASKPSGPPGGGSDWPEITAAEKAFTKVPDDPDADAVVLLKSREGRIEQQADDTVNTLHYFWRMKILNDRGKHYAEVHIPAQKYSRVDVIEARTIKPDGTIVP